MVSEVFVLPDFSLIHTLSKEEVREIISKIEAAMKASEPTSHIEVPIVHHFSDKVYAREMKMNEGELIVGKIHKKENLNILSEGEVTVLSVDGYLRLKAPCTFVSEPGAKRVIYAHSPVTWTTIHGTPERDLEKIEDEFIAKDYEELYLNTTHKIEETKKT